MYSRTVALIGEENMAKLKASKVLVVGLGGVGGYTLEALVRAGIGSIGICDFDTVDKTNLNRQILALNSSIGRKKTEIAAERAMDINPGLKLRIFDFKLSSDNFDLLQTEDWDYVADCIDDVPAKILLAKAFRGKIVSSMGTGNKLNPDGFKISDIKKTEMDRLARAMRKKLRADGVESGIDVLYSAEGPVIGGGDEGFEAIPSISYMPAVAGLKISAYIIEKILKNQ